MFQMHKDMKGYAYEGLGSLSNEGFTLWDKASL